MRWIRTECRGPGLLGPFAIRIYLAATPGQPLRLRRQPDNPVDFNAVICCDMHGTPMGYVAKEDAATIAPEMDRGYMWRGKVTDPCEHNGTYITVRMRVYLWREEPVEFKTIITAAKSSRKRKLTTV